MSLNDAALLESVDQTFDRAADDGYAALTVVSAAGDDEHLGCGLSRELHLLLTEPGLGAGDRFRRSG